MKPNRLQVLIPEIIASLFVCLFLYTAIIKLSNVKLFEGAMRHSPRIGAYAKLLSWVVPLLEIVATLLLIIPGTRVKGLIFSTALMVMSAIPW
jgi:uncharacterized membrane protein YphA (DoxX/SURF4 family)